VSKKGRGRETVLNDELIKNICDRVAIGAPIKYAAESVGVTEASVYNWINKAKQGVGDIYVKFFEEFTRAKAKGAVSLLTDIKLASKEDWRAAAWLLQVRYPEDFSKVDKVALDGGAGIESITVMFVDPKKREEDQGETEEE